MSDDLKKTVSQEYTQENLKQVLQEFDELQKEKTEENQHRCTQRRGCKGDIGGCFNCETGVFQIHKCKLATEENEASAGQGKKFQTIVGWIVVWLNAHMKAKRGCDHDESK